MKVLHLPRVDAGSALWSREGGREGRKGGDKGLGGEREQPFLKKRLL